MAKSHYGGPIAKTRFAPPSSQSPSGNNYYRKKIEKPGKQTGSHSQFITAELNHDKPPGCFVRNQNFFSSTYLKKNLFHVTRICYEKSPKKRLLQTVSSSIVIANGNVSLHFFVSFDHVLRNFKKMFFFSVVHC